MGITDLRRWGRKNPLAEEAEACGFPSLDGDVPLLHCPPSPATCAALSGID